MRHHRQVTTYRIHVELDDITPPIWRQLRVPADMPLPTLHLVLQEAFGWEDYHLHAFRRSNESGRSAEWQANPEIMDFPLPEGLTIQNEADATVTDLLPGVDARATYEYDFGDSWQHTLTVLSVEDADDDVAHLLDGQRAGPPEDCGGVPGYMLLLETLTALAANPEADVDDWEHERVVLTFGKGSPKQILAGLDRFDLDGAGARVTAVSVPMPPVRPELAEVLDQAQGLGTRNVRQMVQQARMAEATEPDEQTCAAMMAHPAWFMRHVGPEGLTLTSAGYLRPDDVLATARQLGLDQEWVGKHNRESQTPQVTEFREVMQALGLVRKAKGRLTVTAAGRRLVDDPPAIWRHIASRLPLEKGDFPRLAGLVVMLDLAGQPASARQMPEGTDERQGFYRELNEVQKAADQRLSDAVSSMGWRSGSDRVPGSLVRAEADRTLTVLRRCGVVPAHGWSIWWQPTAPGVAFLRIALRG